LFRAVNTHLLIPETLSGELEHDRRLIHNAVGNGNAYVGYDMPHPTKGFRFSGKGKNQGIMGDRIKMDAGATLQVHAPKRVPIRLIHNGHIVSETTDNAALTYTPLEPGAYRVECDIEYHGRTRGWIYSNPIYLYE
jgi:hypothetical protein